MNYEYVRTSNVVSHGLGDSDNFAVTVAALVVFVARLARAALAILRDDIIEEIDRILDLE